MGNSYLTNSLVPYGDDITLPTLLLVTDSTDRKYCTLPRVLYINESIIQPESIEALYTIFHRTESFEL